ncbi:MAG: Gfo/Idh/MocA family oxidoreductase [Chloroflexi bacterium]|nr:Gfo/Idh/MocA family oxidoreductase [Chloroflexota bacterium]
MGTGNQPEQPADLQEVRIAFIGCGRNARGHMRRLESIPGARIVGVCDVVPALAGEAASATGATAYHDYCALLDRPDLDAVYLSLPVFAHGKPEMAVIERGLPFFVEKPVALDLATAQEIAGRVARAGLLACVGYQLRYCGSTDAARESLAMPDAGPIGLATGTYWCGTGRSQPGHWRTTMARSGGQLVEQATHTLDMMRFLAGEIAEVFAMYSRQVLPPEFGDCPDVHAVALRFAGGGAGTLSATWAIHPEDWSRANLVDVAFGERRLHWSATGLTVAHGRATEERSRPDRSIDAVFVDAVRRGDGSAIRSPYADGVRSLAVALAANESARRGAPVRVEAL